MVRSNVNPLTLPTLFFAGRAVLTLQNQHTSNHITVKVKQARDKNDRKKLLPIFFVNISLLGDKEQGMVFAGTIYKDTNTARLARNVDANSQLAKVFGWLIHATRNPRLLREQGVSLLHEGKCCRCSLPLTNPISIERGLGDDCFSYQKAEDKALFTTLA